MPLEPSTGPDDVAGPRSDVKPSDRSLLHRYRHGDQDAARQLYQRYAYRLRALAQRAPLAGPGPAGGRGRHPPVGLPELLPGGRPGGVRRAGGGGALEPVPGHHGEQDPGQGGVPPGGEARRPAHGGGEYILDREGVPGSDSEASALLRIAVREALDRLPPEHRRVIELRMESYEVVEIAGITGRSKRSVERILQDGRVRLSKLLLEDR